jgi:hypothetical protein
VSALYLQLNPSISPASLKNWLIKSAVSNTTIYTSNLNNDYTNTRSLMGGTGIFLHNVFNIEKDVVLSGSISIINGAFNLIR